MVSATAKGGCHSICWLTSLPFSERRGEVVDTDAIVRAAQTQLEDDDVEAELTVVLERRQREAMAASKWPVANHVEDPSLQCSLHL
jgi:hypothetical protein